MDCEKEKISASELTYRMATMDDYDDFYKIKCDPENVKWSGFPSAPDYGRMKEWYSQQLNSEKRTIYLCYWKEQVCGFFYLDNVSDEEFGAGASGVLTEYTGKGISEITYGVLTHYSGFGIGTELVRYALHTHANKNSLFCAWVSDINKASERCFEKNGFTKHTIYKQQSLAIFTDLPHNFYLWTKIIV